MPHNIDLHGGLTIMRITRAEMQQALDTNPKDQLFDITANGKFRPATGSMFVIRRGDASNVCGPVSSMSEALAFGGRQEGDSLIVFDSGSDTGKCLYVFRSATNGWVEQ